MSTTTSAFRVGLVGLSASVAQDTLPAILGLASARRVRLVAVADPTVTTARRRLIALATARGRQDALAAGHVVGADFDLDTVDIHDTVEALLARDDLDGIVAARPLGACDTALDALSSGRHVLTDATDVVADARALRRLTRAAEQARRTVVAGHLSGYGLSFFDTGLVTRAVGAFAGVSARWRIVPSPDAVTPDAARLLALTTPAAVLLDTRMAVLQDLLTDSVGSFARATWLAVGSGTHIEIEVQREWLAGARDEARLTVCGSAGSTIDLPLVPPGTSPGMVPRTLRGVLWHHNHGPVSTAPPLTPAATRRQWLGEWVDACRTGRSPRVTTEHATAAAQMAQELVDGLARRR